MLRRIGLSPWIVCLGLGFALAGCAASLAQDEPEHLGRRDQSGYVWVTAESRYGSATISAPVRVTARNKLEVRLPRGTWIECVRSCSETLRRETIDFWQSHTRNGDGNDGPGYFSWTW